MWNCIAAGRFAAFSRTDGARSSATRPTETRDIKPSRLPNWGRIRAEEARAAADAPGAELVMLDYEDACLEVNLATRAAFIDRFRSVRPDRVITHSQDDYHPDHAAVARFRRTKKGILHMCSARGVPVAACLVALALVCQVGARGAETDPLEPSPEAVTVGGAPEWIQELPGQVMRFLATVQYTPQKPEEPWGLFTFSRDCPAPYSVYATSAAWGLAEMCGGIEQLPGYRPDAREKMAAFIQKLQDPETGLFCDPHLEKLRLQEEGLADFRGGTTKYAKNLLAYCDAKPLYAHSSGGDKGEFDVARYLDNVKNGDWDVPWHIGSLTGYQTVELFWLVEQGRTDLLPQLLEGATHILRQQNPETGMWGRSDLPLDQQLGGTLKVIGRFQFKIGLIAPNMDRLTDSLIKHHRERSFYPPGVMSTIPRNVAEMTYACSEVSDYRRDELLQVMRELAEEFRAHQQPDGGFGQTRSGTAAVYWNNATRAAPPSETPRGDMHGTQACVFSIRSLCSEWLRWEDTPFPEVKHWRQELEERNHTYVLTADRDGNVIATKREK